MNVLLFGQNTNSGTPGRRVGTRSFRDCVKQCGDKVDQADELVITGWGESKVTRPHRGRAPDKVHGQSGCMGGPRHAGPCCVWGRSKVMRMTVNDSRKDSYNTG